MIKIEKIQLKGITEKELHVLKYAIIEHVKTLSELVDFQGKSQQYIHLNLAHLFHFTIEKKLLSRELPKNGSIKMEISTAFVVFDSLQLYSKNPQNDYEAVIIRRLIMELFAEMPSTADKDSLAINSKLNVE